MAADRALTEFNAPHLARFADLLRQAEAEQRLLKLLLVGYQGEVADLDAAGQVLQRAMVRPIVLREQPHLSFLLRYPTKDITRNLPVAEGLALIATWLAAGAFRNAHLHTPTEEVQLAFSKKGKASVRVGKVSNSDGSGPGSEVPAVATGHNRDKHRFLDPSRPFLHELGVTDAQGQIIPAMSRKWKQINKFIEVFAAALERSPLAEQKQIHVVDFGSGKGYLTFAI
ncbi:MAG TPA: methyltransferase, partial [Aquabacterium sp.]|nr:methyltransferase [Aquabacterium sp.]